MKSREGQDRLGDRRAPERRCAALGHYAKAGFVADPPGDQGTRVAEQACLAAVAKTVGKPRGQLAVSEVLPAGANTTVMVIVPGANAPWSFLSDAKGHVKSTMFTGKDGD